MWAFFPHQLAIGLVLELNCELMDKTSQIAEEQLVITIDKASKIQKLAFRCFLLTSAKAKKFQDGDRSIRL